MAVQLSTFTLALERAVYPPQIMAGNSYERTLDFTKWLHTGTKAPRGLILGSSTAYRNILPKVLNQHTPLKWFNAASSSQTVEFSYWLFKYAVQKNAQLDYVVLDIYPPLLKATSQEPLQDWLVHSNKSAALSWFLLQQDFSWYAAFYTSYYTLKSYVDLCLVDRIPNSRNGTYQGDGSVLSPELKLNLPDTLYQYDLQEHHNQLEYISKIEALCKANNIRLQIVLTPMLNTSVLHVPQHWLNANEIVPKDSSWYYDSHHMKGSGAKAYSTWLANQLNN